MGWPCVRRDGGTEERLDWEIIYAIRCKTEWTSLHKVHVQADEAVAPTPRR
jgi:hypothetical protein